jgi:hypothetical protein
VCPHEAAQRQHFARARRGCPLPEFYNFAGPPARTPEIVYNRPVPHENLPGRIRLVGIGDVSFEELEAMLLAYLNAGAPKPVLEGTPDERRAILNKVASRGDSQMRALVDSYLRT